MISHVTSTWLLGSENLGGGVIKEPSTERTISRGGRDCSLLRGPLILIFVRSMPQSCAPGPRARRDMEAVAAQCPQPPSASSQTGLSQANLSAGPSHNCSAAEEYIYQDFIALPWKVVVVLLLGLKCEGHFPLNASHL